MQFMIDLLLGHFSLFHVVQHQIKNLRLTNYQSTQITLELFILEH